jgi:glutamate synthase (NADPH/NADH) small chain
MGEQMGFLTYQRMTAGYRPAEERIGDYREVAQRLSEGELRQQAGRCMDCGTPFCHALGCPLANLIPEWNDAVYHGLWDEAYDRLELRSNFPEITGRICPATCESACTLSINDEPVSIREIELAIIETAFERGLVRPQPPRYESGRRVAVVGSGPAGLAAAEQLRRMGHRVTVYERAPRPGGILRYGIPSFKLEKGVLDRRLELFMQEGVEFETDVVAGKDLSARYLRRKHDAVLLAVGFRKPRNVPVPGDHREGIHYALDYLTESARAMEGDISHPAVHAGGKRVLVIGGGDTGADCVGTAVRQGAKKVYQFEIMPRPQEWSGADNPSWPEYPNVLRHSSSHEEGCERRWSVKTKAFRGRDVYVESADFVEVKWSRDERGGMKMEEVPGSEFSLEVDLVIIAAGFTGVRGSSLIEEFGLRFGTKGEISVDGAQRSGAADLFAAGDAVAGPSLVVRAMYQGRSAAESIARYIESL